MLTSEQQTQVSDAISTGLDRAEAAWSKVGSSFRKVAMDSLFVEAHGEPSKIPGYPWVTDGTPRVDEFIALVVDMRNSNEHLKTNFANSIIENGFQRIYYETSALLPAISMVTAFEDGVVTEYLGDGALALFQVKKDDRQESIKRASRAARICVADMRTLINKQLEDRYKLPNMNLGVGLSMSSALVTLVGSPDNRQPKVIGECVWEAAKLSGGTNKVHVSMGLYSSWPFSKGGKMKFHKTSMRTVECYRLQHD